MSHKHGFSFNFVHTNSGVRLPDGCRGFFCGERIALQVSIAEEQLRHCHSERSFVLGKFVGMEENQIVAIEVDGKALAEGIAKTAQKKYGEGVGKLLTSVKTTTTKSSDQLCCVSAAQACVPVRAPSAADKRAHPDCGGVAVMEFQLPERLAPSHDLTYMEDHAVVRYFVRAELWANRKKVAESVCRIVVLGYDGEDPLSRTQRISSACKLRTSFFSKDRVELTVTSKRAAYVGQKLPLTVKIDNQSRSLIQHLNVTLATRLNMRVKDKTSSSSTDTRLLRSTVAVAPMSCDSLDLFVDLPASLASSTRTQHTTVSHELVITATDSDFVATTTRCCLPIGLYHARPHTASSLKAAAASSSSSSSTSSSSSSSASSSSTTAVVPAKSTATSAPASKASPARTSAVVVTGATGTTELADGSTYSGPVDRNGSLTSGIASLTFANGDSFRGIFSIKGDEPPNPLDGVHFYANEPSSFEEIDRSEYPDEKPASQSSSSQSLQLDLLCNSLAVPSLGPALEPLLAVLPHYRLVPSPVQEDALTIELTGHSSSLPVIASVADLERAATLFFEHLATDGPREPSPVVFDPRLFADDEHEQQSLLQCLRQPYVLLFLTKSFFSPVRELTRFLDALPPHHQSDPHVLLCRAACIQSSGGGTGFDQVAEQLQHHQQDSEHSPFTRLFIEVLLFLESSFKRRWVVGRGDEVIALSERCLEHLASSSSSPDAQALYVALQLVHVAHFRPYLNTLSLATERFSDTGSHHESAAHLAHLQTASSAFFGRLFQSVPSLGRPLVLTDASFLVSVAVRSEHAAVTSFVTTQQIAEHCASAARTPALLPLSLDVLSLSLAVLSNEIYRAPVVPASLLTFFFVTSVRAGQALLANGAAFGVRFFAVALRLLHSKDPSPGMSLSRCLAQAVYEIADAYLTDNQATTIALALAGYCYRSGAIYDMLLWCEKAILGCIAEKTDQAPADKSDSLTMAASSSSSSSSSSTTDVQDMDIEESSDASSSSSSSTSSIPTLTSSSDDDDGTTLAAAEASSQQPMQTEESSVAVRDLRLAVVPPETYGVLSTAIKLIAFKAPTSSRTRRLCEQVLSFIRHSQTPDAPVCLALLVTLYDKLGTISSAVKERSAAIAYTRAAIAHYEENEHLFNDLGGTGLVPAQSYCMALLHLGRLAYGVGCNVEALEIAARLPGLMETVCRSTLPNSSERKSVLVQWKSGFQWADSMAKKPQRTLVNWQKAKQNPSTVYFEMFAKSAQASRTEDELNRALFHLQKTLQEYDYPCRAKNTTADSERIPYTSLLGHSRTPPATQPTQSASPQPPSSSSAATTTTTATATAAAPSTAAPTQSAQKVVQWVPDDQVTNCHCCDAKFGMFVWKHHCRSCGQVVCDDCSPARPLPPHPNPVRVCNKCSNPK